MPNKKQMQDQFQKSKKKQSQQDQEHQKQGAQSLDKKKLGKARGGTSNYCNEKSGFDALGSSGISIDDNVTFSRSPEKL